MLGSDAVTSPATWLNDDALNTNLTRRHQALSGFFGLTPSNGAGTSTYNAYRARSIAFSPSMLPRQDSATPGTPSAVPCDVGATLAASSVMEYNRCRRPTCMAPTDCRWWQRSDGVRRTD